MGYPPLSSNVAGWKIPELNGYYFKAGKIVKRNSGFTANNVWLLEGVFDNFLFEKLVYEQFPQSVAVEKSCNSRVVYHCNVKDHHRKYAVLHIYHLCNSCVLGTTCVNIYMQIYEPRIGVSTNKMDMELEVNTFYVLSNRLHAPKKLSKPMGLQVKTNNKKG